jgi:magnesium-transporting ATPase (P-type)
MACLQAITGWQIKSVVPFNPVDKKTTAKVISPDGKDLIVTKGAPQVTPSTGSLFVQRRGSAQPQC